MNQLNNRDTDIDWLIAQKVCGASPNTRHIWEDFSPTSDPKEYMRLVSKYLIDTRYFDPKLYPNHEAAWMGGMQFNHHGVIRYYTAWGSTPMLAAMRALAKCLEENDIWKTTSK